MLVFDTRAAVEFAASGKETPCFYDEVCQAVDVLAAVRYLRTRGARTIARAQFVRTPEPKSLVLLEGAAHGQRIFQTGQHGAVLQMIVGFLGKPCG